MSVSTTCPKCQLRLKLADNLVGKRVRCPKCQDVFSVQQERVSGVEEHAAALSAQHEPRRRRRRRAKRKSKNLVMLLGLGAGFLVMTIALFGAGFWLFRRISSTGENPAEAQRLFDKDGKPRKDIPGFAGFGNTALVDQPLRLTVGNYGFKFTVPGNKWVYDATPLPKARKNLALRMHPDMRELGGLPFGPTVPRLTLVVEDDDGSPIEAVGQRVKAALAGELPDWRLLDEKVITVNGKKAYRLTGSAVMPDEGQLEEIQVLQFQYIGTKSKVFILTFSASAVNFALYREKFEKSGESAVVD